MTREIAEKDLKKKLNLEKPFKRDIIDFYKQIAKDFAFIYMVSGQVIVLNDSYRIALEKILNNNFQKISDCFDSGLLNKLDDEAKRRGLEKSYNRRQLKKDIEMAILLYLMTRARISSEWIIETSQKALQAHTDKYILEQITADKIPTNKNIADNVSERYANWGEGHSDTIVITETQNASESSKNIEANKIGDILKIWHTMGDAKVRESHQFMNLQTKELNEPFISGEGNEMMYPSDNSLGAPISDTNNCRCTVVYDFEKIGDKVVKYYE